MVAIGAVMGRWDNTIPNYQIAQSSTVSKASQSNCCACESGGSKREGSEDAQVKEGKKRLRQHCFKLLEEHKLVTQEQRWRVLGWNQSCTLALVANPKSLCIGPV